MATPFLELEGTWEEIAAQLPDFNGQKLHVTIAALPDTNGAAAAQPDNNTATEEDDLSHLPATVQKMIAWGKSIPPEERAKLPTDLTDNLDHHIYGWPKK